MQFHHLGIAVPAASAFSGLLTVFGFVPAGSGVVESFRCRCDFFQGPNQLIELVEPLPGEGPIRDWIAHNGAGLHHIAFEVPDLMAAIRSTMRAGISFQSRIERGALPNMYVTFCDRRTTADLLIELVEFRHESGNKENRE